MDVKIVIDLDDTLLNSTKFWDSVGSDLEKELGIPEEIFLEARRLEWSRIVEAEKKGDFTQLYSLSNVINFLNEKIGIFGTADLIMKTRSIVELFTKPREDCLFPDSKNFLERYKKDGLLLLSLGHEELQKAKIRSLGISDYFGENIEITKKDKWEYLAKRWPYGKNGPIFIVDDSPRQLNLIKENYPHIITIFLNRPELNRGDLGYQGADFLAMSLKDVVSIIQ